MPFWTRADTQNAILSSLVPIGAAGTSVAAFVRDTDSIEWWENKVQKPSWAKNSVGIFTTVDLLTIGPLGAASYIVYKNGGGFDYNDTCAALGLYGTNLVLALATIPIIKKRNLKCLFYNSTLVHLSAVAASYAFYKVFSILQKNAQIDKTAGLLLVPYALWTGFYAYFSYAIKKENDPVKNL